MELCCSQGSLVPVAIPLRSSDGLLRSWSFGLQGRMNTSFNALPRPPNAPWNEPHKSLSLVKLDWVAPLRRARCASAGDSATWSFRTEYFIRVNDDSQYVAYHRSYWDSNPHAAVAFLVFLVCPEGMVGQVGSCRAGGFVLSVAESCWLKRDSTLYTLLKGGGTFFSGTENQYFPKEGSSMYTPNMTSSIFGFLEREILNYGESPLRISINTWKE